MILKVEIMHVTQILYCKSKILIYQFITQFMSKILNNKSEHFF